MPPAPSPVSQNRLVPFDSVERDAMGRLGEFARCKLPKKVALIPEELTIESGTLTPTLKVKRRAVEARFRDRIEAMYAGGRDGATD